MEFDASIILNVMGLRELAAYGFRSWLIQDYDRPYEVVLNLFNDARPMFERLIDGKNPSCTVKIVENPIPEFFNISAANNLGLNASSGKYLFFANSDIIYPKHFLRRSMAELGGRNICYAVASRMNMTEIQCKTLLRPSAASYSMQEGFDALLGIERAIGVSVWPAISPWILRRDIAYEIGGFDMGVLVAEDRDLCDRVMHYLRRRNLQHALYSMADLHGYHQWHGDTGLMSNVTDARRLIEERNKRMEAEPNSTEDVVTTPLNDRESLLGVMKQTRKPPPLNAIRKDFKGKISRRAKKVWDALVYGK